MAAFVYIDGDEVTNLGYHFKGGDPTEVTDERAIRKLRNHPQFSEVFEGVEVVASLDPPKRRGRPPKVK